MPRARVIPKQGFSATSDAFAQQQIANALDQVRREVNTQPFSSGLWIRGITIAGASTTTVQHGLGRIPSGYIITKSLGTGNVFQSSSTTTSITFANPAAGTATIDVWVF